MNEEKLKDLVIDYINECHYTDFHDLFDIVRQRYNKNLGDI